MSFYAYNEDDTDTYHSFYLDAEEAGTITITELDRADKVISGPFDLRLGGGGYNQNVIQKVSGKFTNIKFHDL